MKTSRAKATTTTTRRSRTAVAEKLAPAKSQRAAKTTPVSAAPAAPASHWTFLTNHAHVLVILSWNPSLVLREVALLVGITERAVQRIIADLETGGIIEREKVGRQNHYQIRLDQPLRHPLESHRTIGELLALIKVDANLGSR